MHPPDVPFTSCEDGTHSHAYGGYILPGLGLLLFLVPKPNYSNLKQALVSFRRSVVSEGNSFSLGVSKMSFYAHFNTSACIIV